MPKDSRTSSGSTSPSRSSGSSSTSTSGSSHSSPASSPSPRKAHGRDKDTGKNDKQDGGREEIRGKERRDGNASGERGKDDRGGAGRVENKDRGREDRHMSPVVRDVGRVESKDRGRNDGRDGDREENRDKGRDDRRNRHDERDRDRHGERDKDRHGERDKDRHGDRDRGKHDERDRGKHDERDRGKHDERDRGKHDERDRGKHNERDGDKHDERARDKHDERDRGKHDERDRGKHDERDGDKHDERARDKHDERDRGKHAERDRGKHAERDRGKHDERDRGKHDERTRGKHDERDRGKHDERDHGKHDERDRDRHDDERDRSKHDSRDRGGHGERDRDRHYERDKRHGDRERGSSPLAGSKRRRSVSPRDRASPGREKQHRSEYEARQMRGREQSPGGGRGNRQAELSHAPPPVPSIHSGVVQAVKPFGIFVQLDGYQRHCLVHHSQVSEDIQLSKGDEDDMKVKALEYAAPVGERVWVKVTEVSGDGAAFKVHGSMKSVAQQDGADLDPTGRMTAKNTGNWSDEPPEVGSIHRGVVKRLEPYGVFVQLDGFRRFGLVHTSQVSNFLEFSKEDTDEEKVAGLGGVLSLNETVWVKVVEVQEGDAGRGPRISCSIKLVSQSDGQDLDPHGLRYRPRDAGGGGAGPGMKGARIGDDAGAVAKGGVINWGYTKASDARVAPAGKGEYELLGEAAEAGREQEAAPQGANTLMAPAGRGRGNVLPAWMTGAGGGGMKPTSDLPGPPGMGGPPGASLPGPPAINSVEEALAILQKYGGGKKHNKDKKKKKKAKEKGRKESGKKGKEGKEKKKGKEKRHKEKKEKRSKQ